MRLKHATAERRRHRAGAARPLRARGQPPPLRRRRPHHGPAHRRRADDHVWAETYCGHGGRRPRHPGEGLAGDRGGPAAPADRARGPTPRPPAGAGLRDPRLLPAREGGDQRVHRWTGSSARSRCSRAASRRPARARRSWRGSGFALFQRANVTPRGDDGPRRGPPSGRGRAPARPGLAAGLPRARARPDGVRGPAAGVRPLPEARAGARAGGPGRPVLARHGLRELRGAVRGRAAARRAPRRHRPPQPAGRGRHRRRALLRRPVRPGRGGVPPRLPGSSACRSSAGGSASALAYAGRDEEALAVLEAARGRARAATSGPP